MSRVGNKPIEVPAKVTVKIEGKKVSVSGPKGELKLTCPPVLNVKIEDNLIRVSRGNETKRAKSLHGLYARLINNMAIGVSRGFEKRLEILGVGYRAEIEGKSLVLQLGYSHPVTFSPKEGIDWAVEDKGRSIVITGCDRQQVGEMAARIRRARPPEPYKGKGIRYAGEYVKRKVGKAIA